METHDRLFEAVRAGETETVAKLLADEPPLREARNAAGDSLLLFAAYSGRRPIVDLLLSAGVEVGLFEACALGLEDRVAACLARDPAAVSGYSHDGWTPLHLASFFGHAPTVRLLLERGADVHARSKSERFARANTPLHAAAANRQIDVASLLIDHGADVNAKDGTGFTPLALAANARNDVLVMMLLEKGARAV